MPSIFGDIITAKMVRDACTLTIKRWSPDYLAEVAERDGRSRGILPAFRSYSSSVDMDRLEVENQTPACVLAVPGTINGRVTRRARAYDSQWAVGVAAIVSGKDEEGTRELAELYAAALRMIFIHKSSLGGFARGTTLLSERIVNLDANSSRTLLAGIVQFGVDVDGIGTTSGGPVEPSEDDTVEPPAWPDIATVTPAVTAGVDGE